jgi:signal transduction histidine kinase
MTTAEAAAADAADAEDDATDVAAGQGSAPADTAAPRTRLFTLPRFRDDFRALPTMFRTRRLLWVPLLLLLGGLALALVLPAIPTEVGTVADLYLQFFFIPPALFTFFIAGFVSPRASYMVGFIYGVIGGLIWSIAILGPGLTSAGSSVEPTTFDPPTVIINMLAIGVIYGTLAAAFAAWYRDFLRGMQERGRARRAEQEAKDRAKRRDERQEGRRVAKRPTS